MAFSRRDFLRASALAAAGTLAGGALDPALARIARGPRLRAHGFGPLVPDPRKLLDLPAGFQYRTLSLSATSYGPDADFQEKLSNGDPVPCRHDGMWAFAHREGAGREGGRTVIVRNHEVNPDSFPPVLPGPRPYDPLGKGGTTTLWVDAERRLERSFVSLAGTYRNCAGGPTPWGTWLTCEECVYLPGDWSATNGDLRPDVTKRHGYVFEVDSRAEEPVDPVPILGMGRFYHEAVAVDPRTGFVYMSEDRDDGLLYRFRPDVVVRHGKHPRDMAPGDLSRGGTLEAMRVSGTTRLQTQNWGGMPPFAPGRRQRVEWVAIPDIDPEMDMERDPADSAPEFKTRKVRTAPTSLRAQGFALGCTQLARVEGVTFHAGAVYMCATSGGPARAGQVWKLDTVKGELTLIVQPDDRTLLEGPDNLCVAPGGDLIVCEDGLEDDYVVGITPTGRMYPFARNAHNDQELAGATFSPDGRTLFVNIQEPGVTFAVWGPWHTRRD